MASTAVSIRWKLAEVMARYRIAGRALAQELDMTEASVSNLKNSQTIPRLDGEKINTLCKVLTKLAGTKIRFADLYEEIGD
jgi:DNA-binding Xre family transcriptional regulator